MNEEKKIRKALEGKRVIGLPKTEVENRKGIIIKVDKDWQFRICWDDNPGVNDDGYQREELKVLSE